LGLDFQDYVRVDSSLLRPADVDLLVSDPRKARSALGWEPTVPFEELVVMLVEADLQRLQAEELFP
jgi:GDPmannose 4,6-dehydratase